MNQNICVFCSSSDKVDGLYFQSAVELGKRIGREGDHLVYGGTTVGLMGTVARAAAQNGSRIIGIIPRRIHEAGIGWPEAEEYIITEEMRERKTLLSEKADAFIALPGGFGTMEEILEVMTAKQLGYHKKAIIFLNTNGFYMPLLHHFENVYEQHFAKESYRSLYFVAQDTEEVYAYFNNYKAMKSESKWYE